MRAKVKYMKHIGQHLREDYEYSKKFINDFELTTQNKNIINVDTILRAHYLICDYFESKGKSSFYGVLNPNMIGSAFTRQYTEFDGKKKYNTDIELCATLFFGIAKNHGFKDGNKRTALLVLLYHLYKINRIPSASQKEFEEFTVKTASSDLRSYYFSDRYNDSDDFEVNVIAHFIRKNTSTMTKQYHSITFIELERALKHYNNSLEGLNKNFVDVIYNKKTMFGEKKIRVTHISCPGMKRQVGRDTLKKIIRDIFTITGNEINLVSIYTDTEPMYRLIQDYEGPLQRLKDK